jgi:hypothetical protein
VFANRFDFDSFVLFAFGTLDRWRFLTPARMKALSLVLKGKIVVVFQTQQSAASPQKGDALEELGRPILTGIPRHLSVAVQKC